MRKADARFRRRCVSFFVFAVLVLVAVAAPAGAQSIIVTKQFSSSTSPVGTVITMTISITNTTTTTLTGMSLSDILPSGLQFAPNPSITNNCGGSVTIGTSSTGFPMWILANGTLPPGSMGFCQITIQVVVTQEGNLTNVTGPVTTNEGFTGQPASATVTGVGSQGPRSGIDGDVRTPVVGEEATLDFYASINQDLMNRAGYAVWQPGLAQLPAFQPLTLARVPHLFADALGANSPSSAIGKGVDLDVHVVIPNVVVHVDINTLLTLNADFPSGSEVLDSHLALTGLAKSKDVTPTINMAFNEKSEFGFLMLCHAIWIYCAYPDAPPDAIAFYAGLFAYKDLYFADSNCAGTSSDANISRQKDASLNDQQTVEDPFVNTQTGSLMTVIRTDTQAGLNATLPWTLMNNSGNNTFNSPVGFGWTHSYHMTFSFPSTGILAVVFPDGTTRVFNCPSAAPSACTSLAPEEDHYRVSLLTGGGVQVTKTGSDQKVWTLNSAGQLVSVGFPNPTQTLTYDGSGNLSKITDSSGRFLTFTSDVNGHITTATDGAGRVSSYIYAASGDLTQVTDPLGNKILFTYDGSHHLTQNTNRRGNITTITYDAEGRTIQVKDALGFTQGFSYGSGVTTITDGGGNASEHMYDGNGRLTGIKDALGFTTSVTRDANDHILTMTDPLGNTWNFTYDGDGNVASIKDPDSQAASFTYDVNDNLLTTTDRLSHITTFTYNANNYVTEAKYADGSSNTYTYNASNELTTSTNANGAMTKYSYDTKGDVTQVTDALGKIWKRGYDAVGRPVSFTDPLLHKTSVAYDKLDHIVKITDPLGDATKFTYDGDGNRTSLTDANGHVTSYTYDARDFLTKIKDALGHSDARTYDGNGNLTSYNDVAGHAMTYSYDANNRETKVIDPLGNSNLYVYDAAGNRTGFTDGNGGANSFTYDVLNRLTGANLSDSSTITYSYDAEGHLTTLTDSTGSSVYAYDSLYRLTGATTPEGNVSLGYDAFGNRTSQTLPGGKVNTYTYDANNRMTDAVDTAGAKTVYSYDAAGHLTQATLGNGAVSNYSYDNAGRLVNVVNTAGASTVSSFAYVLDAVGNKLKVTSGAAVTQYAYDALYRLTSWTPPTGPVTTYSYDAAGNRLTSGAEHFTYDAANRMLTAGASVLTSDHNGNLLSDGKFTYHYDALNRLTSVSGAGVSATYHYDGLGRRVQQQVGAGITHYLNDPVTGQVVTETGATGNFTYFFGLGRVSARSSSLMYYQYDGSGNIASVTSSTDTLLTNYTYSPWGQAKASVAGVKNHYQFAGDATDPGTGFIYMNGRYYRSDLGRFFSQGSLGGSPDSYLFNGSNPVR